MWLRSYSAGSVFAGTGSDQRAVEGDVIDLTGTEPVELDVGDGSTPYSLKLSVQKASQGEDFVYGVSTVMHTYAATGGSDSFTAVLRGCCRRAQAGASW
eukprot:CAMPEP_0173401494 /NCGR_PEP_ID=MMETSP1356-20130122/51107_1 /TAXON_ID=77927 ORGANISM="Hemiselmis virescens, Strain PCC157" /NCGR_SAMPLE_ID=MMETSP1356 /ASSEMBLY_ACC=CAM_ASM_000847 /LENGTH=98 /DNA_ID=CAMNT_0014361647 /DNA_START=69 /DNA_END=362 /DNA_ORIENTATION=+